jgi:excisionase family DNA binding protein
MTSRAAAEQLGVSLRTIQLWVENGALRAWKTPGGHRRIAKNSVDALLRQQRAVIRDAASDDGFTVLAVEDEPVQLQILEMKFEEWALPLKLVTARNGIEGLVKVGRDKPDFIITDLDMPGVDGFQMIREISENGQTECPKVVVVTGLNDEQIAANGGLPEGVPVLRKPHVFDRLKRLIESALGEKVLEIPVNSRPEASKNDE